MIKKILIANRGEIAVRIIRACKEMKILTVAVYSKEDANSLHVLLADESYCIGPAKSVDSYLNINNILSTACLSGCDAIHPGYGFLSENYNFAFMTEKCGLKFIGPNYNVIKQMGNKSEARNTMISAGIPVLSGSGVLKDYNEAKEYASKIGFPIIFKAVNGGGGKGIKVVNNFSSLENSFNLVKKESLVNFNSEDIYMEKYLNNPKHIEVQILADKHGNVIHLFERDCSIQKNKQKLIEESPCISISKDLKNKIFECSLKAAKYVKYDSVGTIEYLVEDNKFYFMEMNTRIQVEHTITEMVTNIDLVKKQIMIADNQILQIKQSDIKIYNHSIQFRINIKDVGVIKDVYLPGGKGIRIDSCIYSNYNVSSFYDSLLLKLIAFAPSRLECIWKLRIALEEIIIDGVNTNIDYLYSLSYVKSFISGYYNNNFIDLLEKENYFDKVISSKKTIN